MEEINIIYKNKIGMAFYWTEGSEKNKVQVIFKEIGFLLTLPELHLFLSQCEQSINSLNCAGCNNDNCKSYLLKTPSSKIDLAVSKNELVKIQDLLCQTLEKIAKRGLLVQFSLN